MNSIKSNFIYSCIYQLVNICVPLVTTPYISRVLGADGVGVYSYNYSVAQLFSIFILLGLNNYGNREVASVRDDREKLSKTFWSIYCLQLFLGIVVSSSYLLYCFKLAEDMIPALLLGMYVISSCFDVNWLYFGIEKFKFISIRNVLIKLVNALALFAFVKSSRDTLNYCLIMGIGFIVTQFSLWPYILKNIKPVKIEMQDIVRHMKPNCILFITVIAVNIYKYMDKVMLGAMESYKEVGFYELSEKVISIPTSLITALGTVMLPRASYLAAKGDDKNNALIGRSVIFAMLFSSSISFGLMAISKDFIPLFYGDGYDRCVALFIVLLPSSIFLAFANVIRTQYLLPHNMDKCYVFSATIGAFVNVVVNTLLIPRYGSVGAGIGTTLAEFSVCFYQTYSVRKNINVKKLIENAIPYVISGMVMFGIVFSMKLKINVYAAITIEIFVGVVTYFFALLLLLKVAKRNPKEMVSMFFKKR